MMSFYEANRLERHVEQPRCINNNNCRLKTILRKHFIESKCYMRFFYNILPLCYDFMSHDDHIQM